MDIVKRDLKAVAPIVILLGGAIGWQSLSPQLLNSGLWVTVLGATGWFAYRTFRRPKTSLPLAWLALAGLLLWQIVRAYGATPPQPAAYTVQLAAGALLALLFVDDSLDAGLHANLWENAILLVAGVFCALELILAVFWQLRWAAIAGTVLSLPPVGYRATGLLLQHPNVLSGFINLALPLAVLRLVQSRRTSGRVLWGLVLAVYSATEFLTSSRGGWLSAALGIGVTLGLVIFIRRRNAARDQDGASQRSWRPSRAQVLAAIIACMLVIPLGWFAIRQLSRVSHQPLSSARAVVWMTGWKIFTGSPIVGAGPGAYPVLSPAITSTPPGFDANHAHDLWLEVAAEEGLVGELLLLAAMAAILLPGIRALRSAEPPDMALAAYLGIGTSLLAHQVVDYMFGVALYMLASVSLLAIYLRIIRAPTIGVRRWTWLSAGLGVTLVFGVCGALTAGGSQAYWNGVQAALLGDWETAQARVCSAADQAPNNSLYAYECGLATDYAEASQPAEALAAFESSIGRPPDWPPESANLGAAALEVGDGNLAIDALERASTLAPRSWVFWASLARARACEGDQPGAASAFSHALDTNPWLAVGPSRTDPAWLQNASSSARLDEGLKGANVYRWWALQALSGGYSAIAIEDVRLGLRDYPGDAGLYATQALVLQSSAPAAARRAVKTALFIEPSDAFVLNVAADLAADAGQAQDANSYAVRWAQSVMDLHYSEKYFYSVYHTFFLPVDLSPDLLRATPSAALLATLKTIRSTDATLSALSPTERNAVDFAIRNQSLFETCP